MKATIGVVQTHYIEEELQLECFIAGAGTAGPYLLCGEWPCLGQRVGFNLSPAERSSARLSFSGAKSDLSQMRRPGRALYACGCCPVGARDPGTVEKRQ